MVWGSSRTSGWLVDPEAAGGAGGAREAPGWVRGPAWGAVGVPEDQKHVRE